MIISIMIRRSVFFIVAAIVVFYFSLILLMLSPLNGSKSVYYGNGYFRQFENPKVHWCKELKWRSPPTTNIVALGSYPGSGNTWLRYLLQQATGVATGSIYMDYGLKIHGFPAENVTDGSVLVVKTHEVPNTLKSRQFKSIVLLIRNPRDAILAEYNRIHKGHIGTAPKSVFTRKGTDWQGYVSMHLLGWEIFHRQWLTLFEGPIHIMFYEALVIDTRQVLRGVLNFLNYTVTEEDMDCAIVYKEGIYRRKKKFQDFDPFSSDMYRDIEKVKIKVINMIAAYQNRRKKLGKAFDDVLV